MQAKHLRLILGDQLNPTHSWFNQVDDDVVYVIAELHQEAVYTKHHIKKITAFFVAMENFAHHLESTGHRVCYLTLDETEKFQDLPHLITELASQYQCQTFTFQRPDEYRLWAQLGHISTRQELTVYEADSEHFLLPFHELPQHFQKATHIRMENFYRFMRKHFNILMEGSKPAGGAWNFDTNNRQTFKKTDLKLIPEPLIFINPSDIYLQRIKQHNINTIGYKSANVDYPTNREQSLQLLDYFCQYQLPNFGNFQDAMTQASPHAWSLYHSRLSFSLNCKMLHPIEVIQSALNAYEQAQSTITLPQIEGFVRQTLGWREYVRGMYWMNMPDYSKQNALSAKRDLPHFFWNAKTEMQCMKSAIAQSLEHAYAHHIQRLMITGNLHY